MGSHAREPRHSAARYDRVYRSKRAYPGLDVSLNGGIATVEQAAIHLAHVDGVMIAVPPIRSRGGCSPSIR